MRRNALEWSVFALGVALTLAIVAFLVVDLVRPKQTVPNVRVALGRPERSASGFVVPATLVNESDVTLEAVRVEATLRTGGQEERSEFEAAFLPRRSQREGWFVFGKDPSKGRLSARATGFERP